jgi:hypothetical protein
MTTNKTLPSPVMSLWDKLSGISDEFKSAMLTADGKELTNVNPHEGIRRMTGVFGPCGTGWGIIPGEISDLGDILQIKVTVWFRPHCLDAKYPFDVRSEVTAWGGVVRFKGDFDLYKKAMTNGISKALSYLGFASEVYLSPNVPGPDHAEKTPKVPASGQVEDFPDPDDWQPLADVFRKNKLPDYGVRYKWRVKGEQMSFWTEKIPNGAWDILKSAGFLAHTGPHGAKILYLLVPLKEVKRAYHALRDTADAMHHGRVAAVDSAHTPVQ